MYDSTHIYLKGLSIMMECTSKENNNGKEDKIFCWNMFNGGKVELIENIHLYAATYLAHVKIWGMTDFKFLYFSNIQTS